MTNTQLFADYKKLIYDCSDWDAIVEWDKVEAEDVIIKALSNKYPTQKIYSHATGAHARGKRIHIYQWNDGLVDSVEQGKAVLSLATSLMNMGIPVYSINIDVEQYWSDWALYQKYGSIPEKKCLIPKLTDKQISDNAEAHCDYVKARTSIPVIVYTANWFINGYAPSIKKWLPRHYLWIAEYWYSGNRITTTWKQLREYYQPGTSALPKLPAGFPREKLIFWQWSGDVFMPEGVWSIAFIRKKPVDVNCYRGPVPMAQFFKYQTAQKPPSSEDQTQEETTVNPLITLEDKAKALNVPYVSQLGTGADAHKNDCGAACGAMITGAYTTKTPTVDEFWQKTGAIGDPYLSFTQIRNVLKAYGVDANFEANVNPGRLFEIVSQNKPAMCLIQYRPLVEAGLTSKTFTGPHLLLVVGVTTDQVIVHDPLCEGETGKYSKIPVDLFLQAWKEAGLDPKVNPANALLYPVYPLGYKAPAALKYVWITSSNGLKIRSTPAALKDDSNRIGALAYREKVHIEKEENGWGKLAGRPGWISMAYTADVS